MPKPTDKEFFLRRLRELDGSAGNKALRENLGWEEEKYFRIRKRLIEEGLVEIGRGKGGSVSLSGVGPEPEPETMDAAETPKLERYHYQRIVEKIGKQLSQDFNNAVIELTANRGKRTGGKWSNPDILAVTLQRFDYIAEDEFLLRSY